VKPVASILFAQFTWGAVARPKGQISWGHHQASRCSGSWPAIFRTRGTAWGMVSGYSEVTETPRSSEKYRPEAFWTGPIKEGAWKMVYRNYHNPPCPRPCWIRGTSEGSGRDQRARPLAKTEGDATQWTR